MGSLSFGQKLMLAFGILMVLVMGGYGFINDRQLTSQTDENLAALKQQVVEQSTRSVGEWLNTRLAIVENTAQALAETRSESQTQSLLKAMTAAGGFLNVYVGSESGEMIMQDEEAAADLPPDYDPRKRPWYQLAQQKGRPIYTEPYIDAGSGGIIMSPAAPASHGRYKGVVGADITLDTVNGLLSAITMAGNGYAVMVSGSGTVLFHPDRELVGKNISEVVGKDVAYDGRTRELQVNGKAYLASFHPIEDAQAVDWYLGIFAGTEDVMASVNNARWLGLLTTIAGLLITLVLIRFGLRVLMAPVLRLRDAMQSIASGEGDLTRRLTVDGKDEFGQLAGHFNTFVDHIQSVVKEAQESAEELRENVTALKSTSRSSRSSVEKQLHEIDMVATAINEMSAAAAEIAQSALNTAEQATAADSAAEESLTTVKSARDSTERLAKEIGDASAVIEQLGKDVANITGVLEVIQSIAEQTNLLALNAAIEAARAGEAGRGFAVVADEVRSLAKRTQDSTGQINSMIERLEQGAESAVAVMQESRAVSNISMEKAQDAMDALHRIAEGINNISNMTTQIATASEEQTTVVDELNSAITRIADEGQQAATATTDNDRHSAKIQEVGEALRETVKHFKV